MKTLIIILILIVIILAATFLPIYNGRVGGCGVVEAGGCWNYKLNLIEYIEYKNQQSQTVEEKQDAIATIKYSNEELGFRVQLPVESKLEKINIEDIQNGAVLHINYPRFKMSIFSLNRQFTDDCSTSATDRKTINGIQFFVHDASDEFSSQESKAVARSYCVENSDLQYVITPFISYALYSGGYSINNPNPGPEKSHSFELFDQAVYDLDFHFL